MFPQNDCFWGLFAGNGCLNDRLYGINLGMPCETQISLFLLREAINSEIFFVKSLHKIETPPTVHWIQDNFVFGQNSKSLLVFRNGHLRSFWIFYATFAKTKWGFFIPSVKKVDLKNRKNEKMAQNGQFWAYFGVFKWLNLFRLNFAPAVKCISYHFCGLWWVGS